MLKTVKSPEKSAFARLRLDARLKRRAADEECHHACSQSRRAKCQCLRAHHFSPHNIFSFRRRISLGGKSYWDFYSWRKAWSGSSFAARCAGSKPAIKPMKVANATTPSARVRLTTKKSPRTGSSRYRK